MRKFALLIPLFLLITACTPAANPDTAGLNNYLSYSPETLEDVQKNSTAILFFHAAWCPTCHQLENEIIEKNKEVPDGFTILKVNYDNEKKLKKKYGVTVQHTLIQLDEKGNEVKRWIGGGLETLKQQLTPDEEKGVSTKTNRTIVKNVALQEDFTGAKVNKKDLLQGCFTGQDCIPSIDNPQFQTPKEADTWLKDEDIVFAVNLNGVKRAYPQRIMNWHEIVNDEIAGQAIAVTFCPLCGSALAFERRIDGIITELGVSGKLHNSDLVMYDRYEGNLWQQITGEAIVGPAARRDEFLKQIPIITTTWKEWRNEHSDTEVLSTDTGHSRNYDAYPYGTYEEDDTLMFGVAHTDKTLHPKTVVYGIEINGEKKAYTEEVLKKAGELGIQDTVGGEAIALTYQEDGQVSLVSLGGIDKTSEFNPPIRLFWFAWAAFNPETGLYK